MELRQEPRLPPIEILSDDAQMAAKPAIAENRAQRVFAVPHMGGNIVGTIVDPFAVIGPAGDEKIVADFLSVEPRLHNALAGHV